MAQHLHIYLIDWEEFHQRFSVDLVEADKETEESEGIFTEAFFSDNAYEGEELADNWRNFESAYEALKKECIGIPRPTDFDTWSWWRKFWYVSPPESELLKAGTEEFDFCKQWLQDFEFVFSRLLFYFGDFPIYRDSLIDFSPLEVTISTLSPETVRQVAARFPSFDIFDYPNCKAIIESADSLHRSMEWVLHVLPEIVNKARDEGKGLCIFRI